MKITICGSMYFAKQMLEAKKILEELGHKILIPSDTKACIKDPGLNNNWEHCMSTNIIKECFDNIAQSDAILVLNYPKNNISGYVGGSTLMEIGLAWHLNKKIFLLFNPPAEQELKYGFEIKLSQPVILNGDILKINNFI